MADTGTTIGNVATGASGIFNTIWNAATNNKGKQREEDEWARERNYYYNQMGANADYQRMREWYEGYQSPAAMIRQLKEAGLSPSMMYGGGAPGGAAGGGTRGSSGGGGNGMQGANVAEAEMIEQQRQMNAIQGAVMTTQALRNMKGIELNDQEITNLKGRLGLETTESGSRVAHNQALTTQTEEETKAIRGREEERQKGESDRLGELAARAAGVEKENLIKDAELASKNIENRLKEQQFNYNEVMNGLLQELKKAEIGNVKASISLKDAEIKRIHSQQSIAEQMARNMQDLHEGKKTAQQFNNAIMEMQITMNKGDNVGKMAKNALSLFGIMNRTLGNIYGRPTGINDVSHIFDNPMFGGNSMFHD